MSMKTKSKQESWEKELRHIYETAASIDDRSDFDCLLPFIRSLLQKERQRIREEVEKMKKNKRKFLESAKDESDLIIQSGLAYGEGFNEAIDQVLKLLEDKER